MSVELQTYSTEILKPWIAQNRNAQIKAATIESLIPKSDAEIREYLTPQPGDSCPFTPAMILKQIETELAETLHVSAETPSS